MISTMATYDLSKLLGAHRLSPPLQVIQIIMAIKCLLKSHI